MNQQLLCQRWHARQDSYRPAGETIRTSDYDVTPISMAEAKKFVIQHHYSSSYPACRFRFGLFTKGALVGAAVFSNPMAPQVLTNVFPGDPQDSAELGRFVLLDSVPANGESWFKARCRELLKREGLCGIIAFSDDVPRTRADGSVLFAGHLGIIYQASNAIFLGRGSAGTLRLFDDGTVFSARSISKIRNHERGWEYSTELLVQRGAPQPGIEPKAWLEEWLPKLTRKLRHPGSLKYAWSLSRSIRLPISQPYPKRT